MRGRRLEATLAVPDELHLFRNALGSALAGHGRTEFESRLLTKHGQQRYVAWTLAATRGGPKAEPTVIVTGIDVTRERQLEAKLLTDAAAAARGAGGSHGLLERRTAEAAPTVLPLSANDCAGRRRQNAGPRRILRRNLQ